MDTAVEGMHDGLANGEAKTGSLRGSPSGVGAKRKLVDERQVFGGDAATGVADDHLDGTDVAATLFWMRPLVGVCLMM